MQFTLYKKFPEIAYAHSDTRAYKVDTTIEST